MIKTILLVLVAALLREVEGASRQCSNNYKFDYLNFALQWGPGYCATSPKSCEKQPRSDFTIHGLWPNLLPSKGISDCCFDNQFNVDEIKPVIDDMNQYWPSLHGGTTKFWSHEWLKHGTCARDVPELHGELNYFGTALKMFKNHPILLTLKTAGIEPSDSQTVKTNDFINAIKKINDGKTVSMSCDYVHHQPIPVLTGFSFCINLSLQPIDCPVNSSRCKQEFHMPNDWTSSSATSWKDSIYKFFERINIFNL